MLSDDVLEAAKRGPAEFTARDLAEAIGDEAIRARQVAAALNALRKTGHVEAIPDPDADAGRALRRWRLADAGSTSAATLAQGSPPAAPAGNAAPDPAAPALADPRAERDDPPPPEGPGRVPKLARRHVTTLTRAPS